LAGTVGAVTVARGLDSVVVRVGPLTFSRADVLLSGSFLVVAVVDAAYLHWLDGRAVGWRLASALLIAAALLVRRTLPIPSVVGVQVGLPFWDMTTQEVWSTTQIVAYLLSSYAVGAHLPWRRAVAVHGGVVMLYVGASTVQVQDPWAGVGSVGLATFAWAVGLMVHRRGEERDQLAETARLLTAERDLRARTAVAEERARIARELHDSLGHEVSVMVLHAGAVRRLLGEDQVEERAALEQVERLGRQAVAELHGLVAALREDDAESSVAPRTPGPSLAMLPDTVRRLRDGGADVRLDIAEMPPLPAGVDAAVYRIVQEALTNAIRHASGAPVEVSIHRRRDAVAVEVKDSGPTRHDAASSEHGGWGLAGMRERVHLLGGQLVAGPRADGSGWRVHASLPVEG
jgi:signal transduction histidine kinase